jgi:NitT/TauT family transport system substrate-binding protein
MRNVNFVVLLLALCVLGCSSGEAAPKKTFTLAVSPYAGWLPWYYANDRQILKKWADHYGISINVTYTDYVPSIEAYVAGQADAVALTNIETLGVPADSGVDSSVIIVGDYSNGNDAILAREKMHLPDLKGRKVYLAERTVSQYVLTRALESAKLKESDAQVMNVSEGDIVTLARRRENVVVTWNPMVMQIEKSGANKLFDSSQIPGEIQDLLVVNSRTLKTSPEFARALVGAWYEVMKVMNGDGAASKDALMRMAALIKEDPEEFEGQLKTTAMFYTPKAALDYMRSTKLKQQQDLVRRFCFKHGLMGEDARSVDSVGISYPDGTIYGDAKNVKMRYVDKFTAEAADGKI